MLVPTAEFRLRLCSHFHWSFVALSMPPFLPDEFAIRPLGLGPWYGDLFCPQTESDSVSDRGSTTGPTNARGDEVFCVEMLGPGDLEVVLSLAENAPAHTSQPVIALTTREAIPPPDGQDRLARAGVLLFEAPDRYWKAPTEAKGQIVQEYLHSLLPPGQPRVGQGKLKEGNAAYFSNPPVVLDDAGWADLIRISKGQNRDVD